jgi:hypothetical protein
MKKIKKKVETKSQNNPEKVEPVLPAKIHSRLLNQKMLLFLKNKFLFGGTSALTNPAFTSQILISKNNNDLLHKNLVRLKLLRFYAGIKWMHGTRKIFNLNKIRFMFASISPVFSNLMQWAAIKTNGIAKYNRWTSGSITATIGVEYLPHCIFIPDITESHMIVREAISKKITILSIISSDSPSDVDLPILGNNHDYKTLLQVIKFTILISKQINK